MAEPIQLFFSYAHTDEALRNELETHLSLLKRQGVIKSWHDRRVAPGQDWAREIAKNIEIAKIILLLVSAGFLSSDYCYADEMKRALDRHAAKQAIVIPIIIRPVDWQLAPFGHLEALPKNGKPVTLWSDRDEAWLDVVRGIRTVTESMMPGVSSTPPVSSPRNQQPTEPSTGQSRRSLNVHKTPTTSSLRKLINQALPGDPELTAFCTNHYRFILNRFSVGMDRITKVNLLLQYGQNTEILQKLRDEFDDNPIEIEKLIEHLIRY